MMETPGWVVELMREKKGADVKLIIEKTLTATDLDKNQSRLSMPFKQMWDMNFLTEAELNIIDEHYRKILKKGVDVMLVDSSGEEWMLNLRVWELRSTFNYTICTGWNNVVKHHQLEKGQIIRIWSFHSQDGKLYFAFSLRNPDQDMAQAIPTASSSSSAITRDSDELFLCVETNRRLYPFPFPKRPRGSLGWIPAPDPDQAMVQPQAPDPDQAMALALFPPVAADELYLCEASRLEAEEEINVNLPAPSPTPPRFINFLDEWATREAEEETHIRMSSPVPVTETTTLDLELRL